tara:strand:- start:912 stop:1031 length:120 start_codon:yes stop_codon:yes gene_type:complete
MKREILHGKNSRLSKAERKRIKQLRQQRQAPRGKQWQTQ